MPTFQVANVTATTGTNGGIDHTFGNPIDNVIASGNEPNTGAPTIGAVNAAVTGEASVHVRCFGLDGSPIANQQVTVTILGISGS